MALSSVTSEFKLEEIAQAISSQGFWVDRDFFPSAWCVGIRRDIEDVRSREELRPAGVGRAQTRREDSTIRRDVIFWIERDDLNARPERLELIETIETIRQGLNRLLFLGLWDWEGHFALYPAGAFYREHLDRFRDESRRTVSIVFFFNPGWERGDGGELRLHLPSGVVDIPPRAGTAVIFMSDQIKHEVLETHKDRASFAGWLRTR